MSSTLEAQSGVAARDIAPAMRPFPVIALLLVIAFGAFLRGRHLDSQPLWLDEAFSWGASVAGSYSEFLLWQSIDHKQPPLSFFVTKAVIDLSGREDERTPEWLLRLPSFICGVLCIPAAFVLGRLAVGPPAGWLMALLVAVDPNMVDQSRQSRMFTMLMLATLVGLALAVVLLMPRRRTSPWLAVLLALVLVVGMGFNQLALALWGALGLAVAVVAWREQGTLRRLFADRRVQLTAITLPLAVLLASPGFYILARTVYRNWGNNSTPMAEVFTSIASKVYQLLGMGWLCVVVYVAAAVGIVLLSRRRWESAVLMAALALTAAVLLIPMRKSHPFFAVRYLVMLQPVLWLGLAALPALLPRRSWRVGALIAVVGLATFLGYRSLRLDTWLNEDEDRYHRTHMLLAVLEQCDRNDAVICVPRWFDSVAMYYSAPTSADLATTIFNRDLPRDDLHLPGEFKAPTTWVVGGFLNGEARKDGVVRLAAAVAEHYRVPFDAAPIREALRTRRMIAVRVSAAGVWIMPDLPRR